MVDTKGVRQIVRYPSEAIRARPHPTPLAERARIAHHSETNPLRYWAKLVILRSHVKFLTNYHF